MASNGIQWHKRWSSDSCGGADGQRQIQSVFATRTPHRPRLKELKMLKGTELKAHFQNCEKRTGSSVFLQFHRNAESFRALLCSWHKGHSSHFCCLQGHSDKTCQSCTEEREDGRKPTHNMNNSHYETMVNIMPLCLSHHVAQRSEKKPPTPAEVLNVHVSHSCDRERWAANVLPSWYLEQTPKSTTLPTHRISTPHAKPVILEGVPNLVFHVLCPKFLNFECSLTLCELNSFKLHLAFAAGYCGQSIPPWCELAESSAEDWRHTHFGNSFQVAVSRSRFLNTAAWQIYDSH